MPKKEVEEREREEGGEIQDTCCYVVWTTKNEEVNFTRGKKKSYMR